MVAWPIRQLLVTPGHTRHPANNKLLSQRHHTSGAALAHTNLLSQSRCCWPYTESAHKL